MSNGDQYEFRYWQRVKKGLMGSFLLVRSSQSGRQLDQPIRSYRRGPDAPQGAVRAVRRVYFVRTRLALRDGIPRGTRMLYDPDLLLQDDRVGTRVVRSAPKVFGSRL